VVTFGVVSDDSFRMQAGYIMCRPDALLMSQVDGAPPISPSMRGEGCGYLPHPGHLQEGGGGANLELFTVKPTAREC